ncbi:MAG: translation initiation factor [Microbacteriaceae bacterium]|nr:translation initiation factor [Microbacteriaceae bacterium]
MRIEDAIRLAQEADLDLVEVAPNSKPPVAKIMDFGKFKYETAQKAKEAKRNQSNTILKEVRFRLKIDVHDYETKRKRAEGFLKTGDKVKAMILFRGREQSRPEQGVRLLQRFAEDVAEFGTVESTPTIDGRNMVMVIGPLKTKAEVKAEHDAKRPATKAARVERPATAAPAPAADGVPVVAPVQAAPVVPAVSEAPAPAAAKAAPARVAEPAEDAASAEAKTTAAPKPPTPKATPAAASKPTPTPGAVPKPRAAAPKTAPADVTTD